MLDTLILKNPELLIGSSAISHHQYIPMTRTKATASAQTDSRIAAAFADDCDGVLRVSNTQCLRLCSALLSKRFLILTGLAGSGKTKLAQAFARWITPVSSFPDPFRPGTTLQAVQKAYSITDSDKLSVEFVSDKGTKVLLPRGIIEQWADYIEDHDISPSIGSSELRERIIASGGQYSSHLQRFETHYKPAAFALLEARNTPVATKCYELVPVGADWTGNENILGYPDGLDSARYVSKPPLELILAASQPQNAEVPHFLILDEMNLSHVERYFADLLSAIESGEEIPLYDGEPRRAGDREIPRRLRLPDNLFIIGTVNVDETTYMFSPKVLDRANVIEFKMEPAEMESFLASPTAPRLEELDGKGATFGRAFVEAAANRAVPVPPAVSAAYEREMLLFFNLLREHNVEFGYRTAFEASRLVHFYKLLGGFSDDDATWFESAMDAVIIQKLLPKLHGSRSRLEGLLWALAWACGAERAAGADFSAQLSKASKAEDETYDPQRLWDALEKENADDPVSQARYPLSFDKVMRMWRKLVRDQFVNFAEA